MITRRRRRSRAQRLDRDVAALLSYLAFIEIRSLTRSAVKEVDRERIRFLADLCHNMPGITRPSGWRPSRRGVPRSRWERAMADRPMTWTWLTSGPEGRAWMLRHIEQAGLDWTPPPPFPERRKGPAPLTLRQRIGSVWGRWPVRAPDGHPPLPPGARAVKAIDTQTVCGLFEEAGRLRLRFGRGGPWLPAHLDPDGVHYLVPDPAVFSWPGNPNASGGTIQWWECTVMLRMVDGEQVRGGVSVLPETFVALPSTLPTPPAAAAARRPDPRTRHRPLEPGSRGRVQPGRLRIQA